MVKRPIERSILEQATYRFSYAVAMFASAEKVADGGKADPLRFAFPTYLLLGYALENGFAAFLIGCGHAPVGDYKTHDLLRARNACAKHGLVFSREENKFIESIASGHANFIYRYPEKMDVAIVNLENALRQTWAVLKDVELCLKATGMDVVAKVAHEATDKG
jgi:hypothetical protein